ncbi:TPA: capsid assembly scaffolding protein Gp46 family protein [Enterococcus faecium]
MKRKRLLPINLQFFADPDEGRQPQFSFDDFKSFAESNEEAQKFLQSQTQSAADKQLESWKQNNLEKIKQDTIKQYEESKKNKSPEQLKLEKLEQEFNAEKALRITSENKAFVAEQITGLNLEGEIKDNVSQFMLNNLVTDNTDFTKKAVEGFTEVLAKVQENHQKEIKSLQMNTAYGRNQQTKEQSEQNNEQTKNPEELLGQMLQQFN